MPSRSPRTSRRKSSRRRPQQFTACAVELLEPKALLSAVTGQNPEITGITIRLNGEETQVSDSYDTIVVQQGDKLEVIGFTYGGDPNGPAMEGAFAFEGYVGHADDSGISIDYADGRFGRPVGEGFDGSEVSHPGLDGEWNLDASARRLVISMVHYTDEGGVTEGRFTLNLQMELPDFRMDMHEGEINRILRTGREVKLQAAWMNDGEGTFSNYSEVDIYAADDMTRPIWVGVHIADVGPGESVKGEFTNPEHDTNFSTRWVPEVAGDYVLKFYADPENAFIEGDETNNVVDVRLTVKDAKNNSTKAQGLNLSTSNERFQLQEAKRGLRAQFRTEIAAFKAEAIASGMTRKEMRKTIKAVRKSYKAAMKDLSTAIRNLDIERVDMVFQTVDDLFTLLN